MLYWAAYGVAEVEGIDATAPLYERHRLNRLAKDTPKVVREGFDILIDRKNGVSIDDSRLEAYKMLVDDWAPHMSGFMVGMVASRGVKNVNPFSRKINRQHFQEHHIISNKNPRTAEHPIWDLAGMNPNKRSNIMFLPTLLGAQVSTTKRSIHQGRHAERVHLNLLREMDMVVNKGRLNSWSQSDYAKELKKIISNERQVLKSGDRILNKNYRPWAKDVN